MMLRRVVPLLACLLGVLALDGAQAQAAAAPQIVETWATEVTATAAKLNVEVIPNEPSAHYRFEYIAEAAYQVNLGAGKDGFTGALGAPSPDGALGTGTNPLFPSQPLTGLAAGTAYRYRSVAYNSQGTVMSPALRFVTQSFRVGPLLLDGRGWEMVSPVDKNGGEVGSPGALAGGGVLQAAANGGLVTYSSSASFGPDPQGAPLGSQYIAHRGGGWVNENITTPMLSGSYGSGPDGVPYQLFSPDLASGLLLNGRHCRGEGEVCPVANPPLPGSGAPAGFQNYYLRDSASGGFRALVLAADLANTSVPATRFDLSLAGAAADLAHVVLSTCAALTPDATEIPLGEGCVAAETNLYEWGAGGLQLLNLLPGEAQGAPGARLAAPSGAVSADGGRVYFTELEDGALYLREAGGPTKLLPETVGGGASFQIAAADGSIAYFTKGGHLWRYDAAGAGSSTDLTPSGGVEGVLGASADGAYAYYMAGGGLFLRHGATSTEVAAAADPGNHPPATGTARVSADGLHLAFVSSADLTGYDNTEAAAGDCGGAAAGDPCSEVYLFDAGAGALTCVSCNPTGGRPTGDSTLPGAIANGGGPEAVDSYKPRALAAGGTRLFFDSGDALLPGDTSGSPDVYEWEAQGTGSCAVAGGCLALISSGDAEEGSSFADASADGSDAFFLTDRSLVKADPGSVDLYDAREGGGFAEPPEPIACEGDACQILPPEPLDPALNTLVTGPGNPHVHYTRPRRRRAHRHGGRHHRHGHRAHRRVRR